MDRLILLVLLACTPPARPADAPVPSPAPIPAPVAPAPAPEPAMSEMPDGCCILEVTIAETGYVLRLWNDGHATEAWPSVPETTKRPFDTALSYDEGKRRFAETQRAAWGPLIAAHDGTTQGPFIAEGTLLPNKIRAEVRTLVFRTRGETVQTATIQGDLRASASLGPFQAAWDDLHDALWGPQP